MDIKFLWYALSGLAGGLLGGMGMGGGTILIPILTIFLSVKQHVAQTVNLVSFIPMAIVALIFHIKNGLVEKKGLWYIILPAVVLSTIGSIISVKIKGSLLGRIFGGFLLILSLIQFFADKISNKALFKNKKSK